MKVIHFTALLVPVFLFCCRAKTGVSYQSNDPLLGKWQWERTEIVRRGSEPLLITPESLGKTMTIEFVSTDKLVLYHNDKRLADCTYSLQGPEGEDPILRVYYKGENPEPMVESGPMHLEGETLFISGGFDDTGGTQYFRKVK